MHRDKSISVLFDKVPRENKRQREVGRVVVSGLRDSRWFHHLPGERLTSLRFFSGKSKHNKIHHNFICTCSIFSKCMLLLCLVYDHVRILNLSTWLHLYFYIRLVTLWDGQLRARYITSRKICTPASRRYILSLCDFLRWKYYAGTVSYFTLSLRTRPSITRFNLKTSNLLIV